MIRSIRWKVIFSLLITASITIGSSFYFFKKGIDRAYSVGINKDVHNALKVSIESQREVFNQWKKNFRLIISNHAKDLKLLESIKSGDKKNIEEVLESFINEEPGLIVIQIKNSKEEVIAEVIKSQDMLLNNQFRKMELEEPFRVHEEEMTLIENFAVPWKAFRDFEMSGRTLRTFEASLKGKKSITALFNKIYLMLVGISVIIALILAYLHTRGFSKRIRKISVSASRVGKGDLDIRVEDYSGDEVGELAKNFDKMVAELKENREKIGYLQKMSAWQEIARTLAHEIKNPLTPIQLSVQQIRSQYKGNDTAFKNLLEESTQIIEEEIESLKRLVTEFSNFARLPAVTPQKCYLDEVLREIISGARSFCSEKGIKVDCKFLDEEVIVNLDRMMFRRAVDNLLMNAVQAIENAREKTGKRGEPGMILVRTTIDKEKKIALIEVADSGEGIREEDRELIFKPYFTRKKGGMGLGLAIVRKVILEHGGEINLKEESPLGGACFKITLPLA